MSRRCSELVSPVSEESTLGGKIRILRVRRRDNSKRSCRTEVVRHFCKVADTEQPNLLSSVFCDQSVMFEMRIKRGVVHDEGS